MRRWRPCARRSSLGRSRFRPSSLSFRGGRGRAPRETRVTGRHPDRPRDCVGAGPFMNARPPAVELSDITKSFGRLVANDAVNLRVAAGSIHALVGENGAGKTTLMKILFGLYQPDRGTIRIGGEEARLRSPAG